MSGKELKLTEKREVTTPAEQMRPGLVFNPSVDIFETDQEIVVLADMPGVNAKDLNIDLRDDTLTLSGEVSPFESKDEKDISIEFEVGKYYRHFSLSEVIDQDRIDANLSGGVLRLTLPKQERATPRKIEVKTA